MTTGIILHHYDASPFTQKALRMLGIKSLAWQSVETPMLPPKDHLVLLTGGYRGTPVMQIGADVYVDNMLIALELERRFPEPSLFPHGDRGLQLALVKWADAFFRAGLHMVIAVQAQQWPEQFRADRQLLFPDIDFADAANNLPHAKAQLRAHAALLNEQLADGRKFLSGDKPSLVDIHAFSVPWFARVSMPEVNELWSDFTHLPAWEQRVAALGEGKRQVISPAESQRVARDATSVARPHVDKNEAQGLQVGQSVTVEPDDSRRGGVTGTVVIASAKEIAVRHANDAVGEVVVHFPCVGYRVTKNS